MKNWILFLMILGTGNFRGTVQAVDEKRSQPLSLLPENFGPKDVLNIVEGPQAIKNLQAMTWWNFWQQSRLLTKMVKKALGLYYF